MSIPLSSDTPHFLSEPSFTTLKQTFPIVATISLAIIALVSYLFVSQRNEIPIGNPPAWFEPAIVKRLAFLEHGYAIYDDAKKRYKNKPFKLITASANITVFPPEYANVLRNLPDLDFSKSLSEDFPGHASGFEPITAINDSKQVIQTVVKKQLSKHLSG